jgi:hypothetical protein
MNHQLKIHDIILELNLVSKLSSILNFDSYYTLEKPKYFISSKVSFIDSLKKDQLNQLSFSNEKIGKSHVFSRYNEKGEVIYQIITKDYTHFVININENNKNIEEIEYVAIDHILSTIFSKHNLITIHASAISFNDQAILFVADSKVGKSTIANRFIQNLSQTIYINDDKPLLYLNNNEVFVHGSPFSGLNKLNSNTYNKVNTIIFIEQSTDNQIIELNKIEKTKLLYFHLNRVIKEESVDKVIHLIENMIEKVIIIKYLLDNSNDAYQLLISYLKFEVM